MLAVVLNPLAKLLAAGRGAMKIATGSSPNGGFDLRHFVGQFIGPGGLSGASFGSGSRDAADEFRMASSAPQAAIAPTPQPSSR